MIGHFDPSVDFTRFSATIISAVVIALITASSEPTESEQMENEEVDTTMTELSGFAADLPDPEPEMEPENPK